MLHSSILTTLLLCSALPSHVLCKISLLRKWNAANSPVQNVKALIFSSVNIWECANLFLFVMATNATDNLKGFHLLHTCTFDSNLGKKCELKVSDHSYNNLSVLCF